jgi:hypothetical protein
MAEQTTGFGARLLDDIRDRTETAIPQARGFQATRLAMQAQKTALPVAPAPVS